MFLRVVQVCSEGNTRLIEYYKLLNPTVPTLSWPYNGKHYKVALLQADGLYQLESTTSRGDAGDVWFLGSGGNSVLSPRSAPSTNAYQDGDVRSTGATITVTTPPGETMAFAVTFPTCSDGVQVSVMS